MEVKERIIEIPQGVEIKYDPSKNEITVKGPKGELKRKFSYDQFEIKIQDGKLFFIYPLKTKSQKKNAHTVFAMIKDMIEGVTNGFTYKLKIFYKHFPIQVKVKGNIVEVINFLGEKAPRVLELDKEELEKNKIKIEVKGDEIIVTGIDKEATGNVAGRIEQITRVTDRDRRKFQDGIFIVEKAGKEVWGENMDKQKLLLVRKLLKKKMPNFVRFNPSHLKRLDESWRKPKGGDSKVRKKKKGKPRMPTVGFRVPKAVRGLLRDGTKPVIVHNVKELEQIENKEEVTVIIASSVGKRKRAEIIKKAEELGLKIMNK